MMMLNDEYQKINQINDVLLQKIKDELEKSDTNYDSIEQMFGFKDTLDRYINGIVSSHNRKKTMSSLKEK